MLGSAPECNGPQLIETTTAYCHRPVRGLRPFYAGFCLALPQICHKIKKEDQLARQGVHSSSGHLFFITPDLKAKNDVPNYSIADLNTERRVEMRPQKPYPPRDTYAKEKDILTTFDVLAVKRGTSEVRRIQFTSLFNVSARKKKIEDYFRTHDIFLQGSEVWGYHKSEHSFRKIAIIRQYPLTTP